MIDWYIAMAKYLVFFQYRHWLILFFFLADVLEVGLIFTSLRTAVPEHSAHILSLVSRHHSVLSNMDRK